MRLFFCFCPLVPFSTAKHAHRGRTGDARIGFEGRLFKISLWLKLGG